MLFQSFYQGVLMSAVAIYAFNRAVVSLGARAASAIIALVPVTATTLAFPVLGELPPLISAAAICIIALGVIFAATNSQSIRPKGDKR
uniref:EamA family transporter n=1 Tax=Bradyrhizobium altum TaxID=1571202 RepID=UPI0035DF38DB